MTLDRLFVDLEWDQIGALLFALARRVDGGFTEALAKEFCAEIERLEPDTDFLIEPMVELDGEHLPLIIDAFARAGTEFEVVFLVPPVLRRVVEEEIQRTLGDVSIYLIRS